MESFCHPSVGRYHLVESLGISNAIAVIVADPGGSQLTIGARTAVVVGRFATWEVSYS